MAELAAKHPARSATARRQRHEQVKRWEEDETSRASTQARTIRRENRVKFEEGIIFLAATASDDEEEVKRLLKEGSDVNFANVDGLTALHQCCIDDNEDMIRLLLDEGANIDRMDNEGWTPLHAAASSGNVSIVKLLMEKGANVALANNEGELPLDLAEEEDVKQYLEKAIESQGIDVERARNAEEWMMLEDAEKLLEAGETMSEATGGATALHVACAKGYLHVINLLLQAGIDVNGRDRDGWTPLHACAHWGQMTATEMLATAGARFDIKTYAGESPEDLVEDDDQRKKLNEFRARAEGVRKTGSLARNKPGDVFEAMQRIRTDTMMKRRTSITRMKKDIAGKRDISQERNIQESFNDKKPSTGSPLRDDHSIHEPARKEPAKKQAPALLRHLGIDKASSKESDATSSMKSLGGGASKAFANLLNSPIGFRKFAPKINEDRLSSGSESSPVMPRKTYGASTDDVDSGDERSSNVLDVPSAGRSMNAGSTPKQPAMSSSKVGLHVSDRSDSVAGDIAVASPLVARPVDSGNAAAAVGAEAAGREVESSLPVVSPSRSGVHEENEKLPEAKRRGKAKQKRQKRRPTQPVSVTDVQEARETLEGPESDEETDPAAADIITQSEEAEEPVAMPAKQRTSETQRRQKARKSRDQRPQTGGAELFQALKDAADASNNDSEDSRGDLDEDVQGVPVEDREQEEKEEEERQEDSPEEKVTPFQSAFKPRARPKPKVFLDDLVGKGAGGSSERREPEGSSGDSSAIATKQQAERVVSDQSKSQPSSQASPRRQPKKYIMKSADGATQRRDTGYVWDGKQQGNKGDQTGNVADDRVLVSEQKETEPKKKTIVTRTVTRKYVKKPRRPTGPVDLDELKETSPAPEGHQPSRDGIAQRTGGDGVNGNATMLQTSKAQTGSLMIPRLNDNPRQSSSSPEGADYKLMYEEEREKYQRLKLKYLESQVDIKDQQTQLKQAVDKIEEMRLKYESERRERKSLEAQLQNMEIPASETEDASKQIAKLKDENAALIRVIGKLSRSTPS